MSATATIADAPAIALDLVTPDGARNRLALTIGPRELAQLAALAAAGAAERASAAVAGALEDALRAEADELRRRADLLETFLEPAPALVIAAAVAPTTTSPAVEQPSPPTMEGRTSNDELCERTAAAANAATAVPGQAATPAARAGDDEVLAVVARLQPVAPRDVAAALGLSRQACRSRLSRLERAGRLSASGATKNRRYQLGAGESDETDPPPPPPRRPPVPAPAAPAAPAPPAREPAAQPEAPRPIRPAAPRVDVSDDAIVRVVRRLGRATASRVAEACGATRGSRPYDVVVARLPRLVPSGILALDGNVKGRPAYIVRERARRTADANREGVLAAIQEHEPLTFDQLVEVTGADARTLVPILRVLVDDRKVVVERSTRAIRTVAGRDAEVAERAGSPSIHGARMRRLTEDVLKAIAKDPGALNEQRLALALGAEREHVAVVCGQLLQDGRARRLHRGTYEPAETPTTTTA